MVKVICDRCLGRGSRVQQMPNALWSEQECRHCDGQGIIGEYRFISDRDVKLNESSQFTTNFKSNNHYT